MASHMDEAAEIQEGFFPNDEKTQKYGNLLSPPHPDPRHIAHLCRLVTMAEIDSLLQTVMFTIYGNQYESREEHLLLTMFQVRRWHILSFLVLLLTFGLVRSHLSIRQHPRVFLSASRKHPCFSNDDNIHTQRTWT